MASAHGRRAEIDALRSTSSAASPPTRVSNGASSWRRSATRAWAASPCVGPAGTTSTTTAPAGARTSSTSTAATSSRRSIGGDPVGERGSSGVVIGDDLDRLGADRRGSARGPPRAGGRPTIVAASGRRGSRSGRAGTAAPATIEPDADDGDDRHGPPLHPRRRCARTRRGPVRGLAGRMRWPTSASSAGSRLRPARTATSTTPMPPTASERSPLESNTQQPGQGDGDGQPGVGDGAAGGGDRALERVGDGDARRRAFLPEAADHDRGRSRCRAPMPNIVTTLIEYTATSPVAVAAASTIERAGDAGQGEGRAAGRRPAARRTRRPGRRRRAAWRSSRPHEVGLGLGLDLVVDHVLVADEHPSVRPSRRARPGRRRPAASSSASGLVAQRDEHRRRLAVGRPQPGRRRSGRRRGRTRRRGARRCAPSPGGPPPRWWGRRRPARRRRR